ncbi:MAG: hypothetical protein QF719_00310 [Chloroflexota bacterium]|jgi:hypothetical protein|nr:hypothetical protein [Chloroflexota bacterium]MDP6756656.1 hypothetical protein [Chloroflexota bacterium]
MSAEPNRDDKPGEIKSEIQELATQGFDPKGISSLFYQRALWRNRIDEECKGEVVPPPGRDEG